MTHNYGLQPTQDTYRQAAALLWGEAGDYAAAEFTRLNRELFAGSIPPLPVIIGLTAYGKCIGATLPVEWCASPRITLVPMLFRRSVLSVTDTLLHEMVHAALLLRGECSDHNDEPWCRLISELSPPLLGHGIVARPVRTRRVPNPARETDPTAPKTVVVRAPVDGALPQSALASWPHSVRPADFYADDRGIPVPTY